MMNEILKIEDWDCYQYAKKRGYEPLIDRRFGMDINTRIEIQQHLFGEGHSPEENERFYRYCWDIYTQVCSECMKPLRQYSAVYISHILSRGAFTDCAHDVRNINILCFDCHQRWENGDRKSMRIYSRNMRIINDLKRDYNRL